MVQYTFDVPINFGPCHGISWLTRE